MKSCTAFCLLVIIVSVAWAQVTIERIGGDAPFQPPKITGVLTIGTAWPVPFALARRLSEGTSLEVLCHPVIHPDRWSDWSAWCHRQEPSLDAVITLRGASPADLSYRHARAAHIRCIEIDASNPLDGYGTGIALVEDETATDGWPGGYWLSTQNLGRMAEIVARDLQRLDPKDAPIVEQNLGAIKSDLAELARLGAITLAACELTEVADPSGQFGYLIQSLGLIEVTESEGDAPRLVPASEKSDVGVPIHTLTALLEGEKPWQILCTQYRENIEKLHAALCQPNISNVR